MSSEEKQVWAILADINPYRYEINEKSHIWKKTQKQSICDQISFGIQLQTFLVKVQYQNTSTWNLTHRWKNSILWTMQLSTNTTK